ncbi:MAG: hypothetical protein Q8R06_17370 [Polaromonas sp.]|nr:hypothetical protein [Polaromonas sp.]
MQDRDYYKEWWKKRTGYEEKAAFRLPAHSNEDDDGGAYLRRVSSRKKLRPWHPLLTGLLAFFICLGIYLLLKIIKFFAA